MKKLALLLLLAATTFTACKKDDEPDPTQTGAMYIELEHVFGPSAFVLNSADYYVTANGDSVKFSLLKYYISNIKLTKSDNTVWTQPDSYYLYDAASPKNLEITGIPEGDYTAIEFTVGVDSARNVSGAQTGALDPANGMFWSWNTGYIFFKAEGTSPSASMGGDFTYHVGGYKGDNKAQRTISLSFNGAQALVRKDVAPELHLSVDMADFFNQPTNLDIATLSMVHMAGADAAGLANRYANIFHYEHIHN